MNKSKLGQRLLIYGAIVLIYALVFKDVTVDGNIVNLNLLSERQNLVIVGALMVLVGTILSATSRSPDKADAPSTAPEVVNTPKPNPVLVLRDKTDARLQTWAQALNGWRSEFLFRAAFALICSVILIRPVSFMPWPIVVVPLLVFLPLSMRKLPPKIAVSKTCLLAAALTIPLNILFLTIAISEDLGLWDPILNLALALILIACYITYGRESSATSTPP